MRAFLSYSGKDKTFVKRLYESLTLAGLNTFFDEKDIKVGDNIPRSIEQGMHEASALIYVISSNSLKSAWVQEELSMAQVKAKSELGFKILPVLIEPLHLPVGIAHIKYADFTGWEKSERFFIGLDELLDGIGAKRRVVEPGGVAFSIRNHRLLLSLGTSIWRLSATIDGLLSGYREGLPADNTSFTKFLAARQLGHRAFDECDSLGIRMYLADLGSLLNDIPSDTFTELRSELQLCSKGVDSLYFSSEFEELQGIKHNLENFATRIFLLLHDGLMQMNASIDLETSGIN